MNRVTSKNVEECLKYTYTDKITASEYASFIRFLIMTMKKDLPIEIFNNEDDTIIRGKVNHFTIDYPTGEEGNSDNLTIKMGPSHEEELELQLLSVGKERVSKDSKSGTKTFYRFYIYPASNEEGYRITFNRRVTKK